MDKLQIAKSSKIKLVVETETNLSFDSHNFLKKCPFCSSGTGANGSPAFSIKPRDNIFNCFSCGKKGNSIEFIKFFRSLDNAKAIDYLVNKYNGSIQENEPLPGSNVNNDDTFRKTIYAIVNNDVAAASEYLKGRAIDVKSLPAKSYFYDSIQNAVVFFDSEKKLINKRLISPKKGQQKSLNGKGSVIGNAIYDCLYNAVLDTVYLTEGVINTLSLFPQSAIAIFTTSNQFTDKEKLSRYIAGKRVVLAFDGDEAGNKCTEYYRKFILDSGTGAKSLYRLKLPPDQDINDILQAGTLSDFLYNNTNFEVIWEDQDHIDILMKPIPKNSEKPDKYFYDHRFYKEKGKYFSKERGKTKDIPIAISNFIMEILYHFVDGSNNTKRLIKIQRYTGELITVEVLSSETKLDTFETILKSHNCTFLGNAYQLKSIFMVLMDNQREAFAIEMLGYIPEHDLYAFSDSIITSDYRLIKCNKIGIANDKDQSFYLPAFAQSNVNNKAFTNQRKFRFKEGSLNFQEWTKLIYQAYNVNGSISICYLILALFRDIVFLETGFFPFLYLFGQPGVGKSSFIDFLLRLFGDKEIGVSVKNSTVKAIARTCSQKRNSLLFLKEYDNSIDREMIAFFKNAYDGATYSIAQKTTDNKTESFLVESAMVIDGNVLPTAESALYDRMIVLHFETHQFSKQETEAYKKLVDESEIGLGKVLKEILSFRDHFKHSFKSEFRKVYDEIKYNSLDFEGFSINNLPERTIKHIAFLLTPFRVLYQKLKFPFDFNELVQKIIQDSIDKFYMLNDIKDVSVFWDAINWERNKEYQGIQENKHYLKEYDTKVLFIKFPELYPYYMSFCKLNSLQYIDKNSLLSLLTSNSYPPFIPGKQKGRNKSVYKTKFGNCYMFKFDIINDDNSIKINGKDVNL